MYRSVVIFLVLFNLATITHGLKCYTCSVGEDDFDRRCVDDPATVELGSPITNCNKKYCVSVRQEYVDPKGKVASMLRTCEDKPQHFNEIIDDGTFRVFYRACQIDLCNDGTGYDTSGSGIIIDEDKEGVIYTLGLGDDNSAVIYKLDYVLATVLLFVVYFY